MSIKCCNYIPITLVMLAILLATFNVTQLCYAGGAVILIPAKNKDVPKGAFIPERRRKEIEKKVTEFRAKMKGRHTEQQNGLLPKTTYPGQNTPKSSN